MIAHTMFVASDKPDGVCFHKRAATKKLQYPETDWPISKFKSELDELARLTDLLDVTVSEVRRSRLAVLILEGQGNALLADIAQEHRQTRRIQEIHNSNQNQANPEIESQTPEDPDPKV